MKTTTTQLHSRHTSRLVTPGHKRIGLCLLLCLGLAAPLRAATVPHTILFEGFEGAFPAGGWTVGDDNPIGVFATWDDVHATFGGEGAHTGNWKAYCAGTGYIGDVANPFHRDDMDAFMRHPIDLTGYASATLTFWYKIPSIESCCDEARVFIDSVQVWTHNTPAPNWTEVTVNLNAYVGAPRTLQFVFHSDGSFINEGWYVDDIAVVGLPRPANDNFANCQVISGCLGSLNDCNVGATKEPNEHAHAGNSGGRSVWYCWEAPRRGPVLFSTTGSGFDTLLAVYEVNLLGVLTEVASNDDILVNGTPTSRQSRVQFFAGQGTVYYIAVDGYNGATGAITLNWGCDPTIAGEAKLILEKLELRRLKLSFRKGYELQSAFRLPPGGPDPLPPWQPVTEPVQVNGDQRFVIVETDQTNRFFRLKLTNAPVYSVTNSGVSAEQFAVLQSALGLPAEALWPDGTVRYTDPEGFQRVPTEILGNPGVLNEEGTDLLAERFLFDEIRRIRVLDDATALARVRNALTQAGLTPAPAWEAVPRVGHSTFQAVDAGGVEIVNQSIDTQVHYEFSLGGLPVVGSGVRYYFSFASVENMASLVNAQLFVAPSEGQPIELPHFGQPEELPGPIEAADTANRGFLAALGSLNNVNLSCRLVYYAPPLAVTGVQVLLPHYEFSGTFTPPGSAEVVPLRTVLIPAVRDTSLVPSVSLIANLIPGTNVISAQATVTGGREPYTYQWSSSTASVPLTNSGTIQVPLGGGVFGRPATLPEVVTVVVTDANGISAAASYAVDVSALGGGLAPPAPEGGFVPAAGGVIDVGTEWVGLSQNLGGSGANAAGFVNRFRDAGTFVRFNWGDFAAWERDFKDPARGGNDTPWVDNADAVFYTGHANANGWTFPGTRDDGFLGYTEALYGQNDLEWLVVAACGPLQLGTPPNTWCQRWGPAFQGLHLLCGYGTVTGDNTVEGRKWADYMVRGWTVRQAWMQTGIEVQGPTKCVSVMGVYGPDGLCNWNDHFWGRGAVGPDIRDVRGCWLISSWECP